MKLRIYAHSVRVRLTQTEVARLAKGERIEQTTAFSASSKLISSIEALPHAATASVEFDGLRLAIFLPSEQAIHWATSSDIGIKVNQPCGKSASLSLLVEKDFECLHPGQDKTADAYPNPRALRSI
jgi:hypothetical protein